MDWEEIHVTDIGTYFGETEISHVVKSIQDTRVALMGVLTSGEHIATFLVVSHVTD